MPKPMTEKQEDAPYVLVEARTKAIATLICHDCNALRIFEYGAGSESIGDDVIGNVTNAVQLAGWRPLPTVTPRVVCPACAEGRKM